MVIYDPSVLSYVDLLRVFWAEHNPYSRTWSRQYMNAVFYMDEQELEAIRDSVEQLESGGREVKTRISRLDAFYPAEDYHQKHALRQFPDFYEELDSRDETGRWLHESTLAARLNGYLGGYGTCDELQKEVDGYDLSARLKGRLKASVCSDSQRKSASCPLPEKKR